MRVRVRDKRQITLPRDVCEQLGVGVGDGLDLEVEGGVLIVRPTRRSAREALEALREAIRESGVTEEELQEAGRRIRREHFRRKYPELARKYDV